MKTTLHKAASRGHANHGWLDTYHTFSFANYYNPERIHFGALRVLNDDFIAGGEGFGMHPHDNMEIVTIPLTGTIEHKDSMGNATAIPAGEIQVMSAGTGIFHSEFNKNKDEDLRLLQIWVFPNEKNAVPRYSQISLSDVAKPDELYQIVSPNPDDSGAWIRQQAWFHLGDLSMGWKGNYTLKSLKSGVYFFVIEGSVTVAGYTLQTRDGLGVSDVDNLDIEANILTKLLVMEIPLQF
jgi:quercetin 2,3-dioxygenase